MPRGPSSSRLETITRFDIADLSRRAHALADGTNQPSERPVEWLRRYREVRGLFERIADIRLLNRFAEGADGDDAAEDGVDVVWELGQMGDDPRRLTRRQRQAIAQVASALDGLVNSGECSFAADEGAGDAMPAFVRVALAVEQQRVVRLADLCKLKPEFSGQSWTRHAATMVDLGLSQTLYGDYMHVFPERCTYWLEENDPMRNKRGDVVHGDKIHVEAGVALGRGASVNTATVQDNRFGGAGTIEGSGADLVALCTKIVAAVNERDDAPGDALTAAASAKALAKAGDATGALAALRKGGTWLLGVLKEVAAKGSEELLLRQLGLK